MRPSQHANRRRFFQQSAALGLGLWEFGRAALADDRRNDAADDGGLRVGTFDVDASPPVGSPLAYDPTKEVTAPLSCRGLVLLGSGRPIVLCAVDWIGIGNEGQTEFRQAIARAVGTDPGRVEVHTLHQHDAPRCDFTIARMLAEHKADVGEVYDLAFNRDVIRRAAEAARRASDQARPVTHLGLGQGMVE